MAEPVLRAAPPGRARSRELAASLARMKATLEATTDAILVTSNAFEVTDYNERYMKMWSLPASVLATLDHQRILAQIATTMPDPDQFIARVRAIYDEAPATTVDTLELLDGRVIERHSSPQLVEGQVVGRVWSFSDVTEARRVEQALLEETHVLEWLNRVGRDLTSTLELQAVAQAATDAATRISGAKFGSFLPNPSVPLHDLPPLFSRTVGAAGEFLGNVHHPALAEATQDWQQAFHCDDLHADAWGPRLFPAAGAGAGTGKPDVRSVFLIPVMPRPGVVLGTLAFGHDAPGVFTDRVKRLLGVMAAQAAVAIDNARLHSQVRLEVNDQRLLSRLQKNSAERLQSLTRRLMDAEEQERKRLGRELHDQVGANLSALLLGLALMRSEVPHAVASLLGQRLADFESLLHDTMGHVRDVLADLRPIALDELGLFSALRHQAAVLTSRTGVAFSVHGTEPSPRLGPECEIALYRIAQEAWNNVLKHAEAGRVTVTLTERGDTLSMLIEDDGKGFEPADRIPGSPALGLTTMRERAEAIGAVLELDASPGMGVHLSLHLPRAAAG